MSHQGFEGWFPECLICRMGNVGPIICLDPTCHEQHGIAPVQLEPAVLVSGDFSVDVKLVLEDGHYWKCCQLCDRRVHSDAGAFGVYAACVDCFNSYALAKRILPVSPDQVEADVASGILRRSSNGIEVSDG